MPPAPAPRSRSAVNEQTRADTTARCNYKRSVRKGLYLILSCRLRQHLPAGVVALPSSPSLRWCSVSSAMLPQPWLAAMAAALRPAAFLSRKYPQAICQR